MCKATLASDLPLTCTWRHDDTGDNNSGISHVPAQPRPLLHSICLPLGLYTHRASEHLLPRSGPETLAWHHGLPLHGGNKWSCNVWACCHQGISRQHSTEQHVGMPHTEDLEPACTRPEDTGWNGALPPLNSAQPYHQGALSLSAMTPVISGII